MVLAIPATARAQQPSMVSIHDHQYHPAELALPAGSVVTWINEDEARHDLATTTGPVAFQSPELSRGESFSVAFDLPGTYAYLCTLHPDMVGSVTVAAPVTTTAAPTAPSSSVAPSATADVTSTTAVASVSAAPTGVPTVSDLAASPAAEVAADLETSARPYLLLLGLAAAAVLLVLLLLGVGQRPGGLDG